PSACVNTRRTPRHIGLTDPVDDLGRETRPVVDDNHSDRGTVPAPPDDDLVSGEVDGVLHQITQAVNDAGVAPANGPGPFHRLRLELDVDAEVAMRRGHFLDQRSEWQARHVLLTLG